LTVAAIGRGAKNSGNVGKNEENKKVLEKKFKGKLNGTTIAGELYIF